MTLYYEPENQPGSELVKKDSLFWTARRTRGLR